MPRVCASLFVSNDRWWSLTRQRVPPFCLHKYCL